MMEVFEEAFYNDEDNQKLILEKWKILMKDKDISLEQAIDCEKIVQNNIDDLPKAEILLDNYKRQVILDVMVKDHQKYWTDEDKNEIDASMKNISDLPIWKAIYQARKWALLEARASTVKIDSEEDRKSWFDKEIDMMTSIINNINYEKK